MRWGAGNTLCFREDFFICFLAVAPAQQKLPWRGGSFCSSGSRLSRNLAWLLCPQNQPALLVKVQHALVWKHKMDVLLKSIDCHGLTRQLQHHGRWQLVDIWCTEHLAAVRQLMQPPASLQLYVVFSSRCIHDISRKCVFTRGFYFPPL